MIDHRDIKPIFTLRGHNASVTSLSYCQLLDGGQSYLISGDEDGTLVFWDLATFKLLSKYEGLFLSTIQSIKNVNISVDGIQTTVLVVQSRNDGIQVLHFYDGKIKPTPNSLVSFPTHESLFSRGDAKSTRDGRALLAHPSQLENYLVTVRILGENAKTELSGTAGDCEQAGKKFPIFDVIIKNNLADINYSLFVAYEDGWINIFQVKLDATRIVPALNAEGLSISLIKRIDTNFRDFVSAYDLAQPDPDNYLIVSGSPDKNLCFIRCSSDFNCKCDTHSVRLKHRGVAAISVRPDARLVAVAGWDKTVRFYSMSQYQYELVATINHHSKQVQAILFTPKPACQKDLNSTSSNNDEYLVFCASQDGTISMSSSIY